MASQPDGKLSPLLHALGVLYRATPHFRGKWKLSGWVFDHWLQRSRCTDLIRLNRNTVMLCNFCSGYGVWSTGTGYEHREAAYFCSLLQPGMTFLDVGANVGYYSLLAAPLVGASGGIHAFEPVSTMHEMLRSNFERNQIRQAVANRLIVSDSSGPKTINLSPEDNCGSSSVGIVLRGDHRTETVESITLDDYLRQRGLARVDVIKMDVEGHETAVLRGASALLREKRPVWLIEVRENLLRQSGSSRAELYGLLQAAGYAAYKIRPGGQLELLAEPSDGELIIFRPG
jgi:FkbM family methyltransferase